MCVCLTFLYLERVLTPVRFPLAPKARGTIWYPISVTTALRTDISVWLGRSGTQWPGISTGRKVSVSGVG